MIGRCMSCYNISPSERPDMYLCREGPHKGLINTKFADGYHECFVGRRVTLDGEVEAVR